MQYSRLCETYAAVEDTSKRLEKTAIIAELLKESNDDLERVMLLLQGRVFPAVDKRTIGVSSKIMLRALARVTGSTESALEKAWSKRGDLGLVAEKHITGKSQLTLFSSSLTVERVHGQIARLAGIEGAGSVDRKLKIISELLSHASPLEARYITRTILEELRIGIASGTLRDAIVYAFLSKEGGIEDGSIADREKYNAVTKTVQDAYDRTNDFAQVALAAKKGLPALTEVSVEIGTPIKVMLGLRGTTVESAMKDLADPDGNVLLQYKYDGFRVEIHKDGERIRIFTRRLEDVTKQFPDIVERAKKQVKAEKCILDGEAIGVDPKTGKYRPFQEISQRIRRKHGIKQMVEKLPVDVRVFDVVMLDGEETLDKTMRERHETLRRIITDGERFGVAHTLITKDAKKGQAFYDQALADGEEGLFAKKLDSVYQPGTRVGNWIKLKSTMEPLDLVVIGAEWGEGKRSGWLTSYTVACQDENGELQTIGHVATGLKELPEQGFSFQDMTELLQPLIEYEHGRQVTVKPSIVLEVAYEEIQKSPQYGSGYALRFPRVLRNRTDERDVEDVSTLSIVEQLYAQQRNNTR